MFISFMNEALKEAKKAFQENEVPVGAILVNSKNKTIIARDHNQMQRLNDPTSHAEMNILKKIPTLLNKKTYKEFDLYVTLEPCPMCIFAASLAKICRIYFGAYDPERGGIEHGTRFLENNNGFFMPELYGGIGETESKALLNKFFASKRGI